MTVSDQPDRESDLLHLFKNHLAIIVGFCDLLADDLPAGDRRRDDVLEIHRAGEAAMALLPELAKRLTQDQRSGS
jgi:hypothetical protein